VLIHRHYTLRQTHRSTRILSWFRANQYLFLLYNDVCLAEIVIVVNGNTNFVVYAVHSWGNVFVYKMSQKADLRGEDY